jgi:hypothetical protein
LAITAVIAQSTIVTVKDVAASSLLTTFFMSEVVTVVTALVVSTE